MSPTASPPSLVESTKAEVQEVLKDQYKINKNISQTLTAEECRQLLELLSNGNTGLEKLLTAYAGKNFDLGKNNAFYGRQRALAEKKAEELQQEYQELQNQIKAIEANKDVLVGRKQRLENETSELEQQISELQAENQLLATRVKNLDADQIQLAKVNHELKKDNKRLKNLVDAIRLNLSRNVKGILGKEDGELRKALAKLYKSILG
jgi:DNA repair exonuclease SbcCD ATPase subunit